MLKITRTSTRTFQSVRSSTCRQCPTMSILMLRNGYASGPTSGVETHSSNDTSSLPPSMLPSNNKNNNKTKSQQQQQQQPELFSSNASILDEQKHAQQQQLFSDETRRRLERLRQLHFHPTNIPDSPDFGTNQYININEELKQQLKEIVSQFHAPIRYAFAYGSGVFQQAGYDAKKKPMLDFVFGVSHPGHWHALNMQQNPHHYSGVRMLGSSTIAALQDKVGAGVYFNPYVEIDGVMIKYGVVSIDKLCKDLIDWETLYVAGRMHKPVKILRDDARVRLANQVNLTEAVRVALLTLPERFNEDELFERIAGISYTGDFRMIVGENPNKIRNIVHGQLPHFHRLYFGLLDDLPNVAALSNGQYQQNLNPHFRGLMIQKLPSTLYKKVLEEYRLNAIRNNISVSEDKKTLHREIASSPDLTQFIDTGLRDIVAGPAMTQSIKGIFTAGPLKTTRYALEKLLKWKQAKK